MTIIVDVTREPNTNLCRAHALVVDGATIAKTHRLAGHTFHSIAEYLMYYIVQNKVERVIFDVIGFGKGLYDTFMQDFKETAFYKMRDDGTLVHPKIEFDQEYECKFVGANG